MDRELTPLCALQSALQAMVLIVESAETPVSERVQAARLIVEITRHPGYAGRPLVPLSAFDLDFSTGPEQSLALARLEEYDVTEAPVPVSHL